MKIEGSVALVTGAASGLGNATALMLHERGAQVVLVDRPSSDGQLVADRIGPGAVFAAADVASADEVAVAIELASGLGDLRIVVNCAGVATPGKVLSRAGALPLEEFARVVQVNLVGTFNVLRLAAQAITTTDPVAGERGVIVNTASVAAFDGQIGQPAYAASKGGVAALTLPVARELGRNLIRVMTRSRDLRDPHDGGTPARSPVVPRSAGTAPLEVG